jgi:hypothetical protein
MLLTIAHKNFDCDSTIPNICIVFNDFKGPHKRENKDLTLSVKRSSCVEIISTPKGKNDFTDSFVPIQSDEEGNITMDELINSVYENLAFKLYLDVYKT